MAVPTGLINEDFNSILTNFGYGFSANEINAAMIMSGGHPNLRAIVDFLQAEAINKMLMTVKKTNMSRISSQQRQKMFVWVDVGSKFSKMSTLLCSLT